MNGMTITEKILARHAGKANVQAGDAVWVDADLLMTHDVCGPGTIGIFKKQFGANAKVFHPGKVAVIPDHYIFTQDIHAKRNLDILRAFAKEQGLPHFYDAGTEHYKGVCHVALAEEGFTVPGIVLFGTDSHTCTAGAFGLFATGIGNTDAAFILGTGKLWLKVPATRRVVLDGGLPAYVMAKDVILHLIGKLGVDGANYQTVEFDGDGVSAMDMDERMTLCNMVIEAGGKNGVVAADGMTEAFLKGKTEASWERIQNDAECRFLSDERIDSRSLEPVVAKPYSPAKVEPVRKMGDVKLDQCYIGSCTGGKMTDFLAAARILRGNRIKVKTVVVPATCSLEMDLKRETIDGKTLHDIFVEAGVEVGPPSCAACLGGPEDTFGRLNGKEVCISTTNRNFPGRMGSMESKTYLASPLTVAASALKGKITDPREYLS
ncbi:MAG TPA: aconitase/3-isopropylmalate dehydratase large subunit family protein [bacterium]